MPSASDMKTSMLILPKMQLRDRKSVSLDLATGTGKSFVMYALAAIALAEGVVDRVLVLVSVADHRRRSTGEIFDAGRKLGAVRDHEGAGRSGTIPGIKRGNQTVQSGDICIENIHAVYENAGSSIADSFRGNGARTLVLNDEAHHLFSPPEKGLKEWIKFLLHTDYGFRYMVNVTGTPYIGTTIISRTLSSATG